MITFNAEIEKFETNGEKTGWSYIFVPNAIAEQIRPGERRCIRVKGKLDELEISGIGMMPMRHGDFILSLNKGMRKQLRKEAGAKISLQLEFDADFKIEMPDDLEICLATEEDLLERFLAMRKSYQNYFINWLNTAKTEVTRTKRIVMILGAMAKKQDFGEMIRSNRADADNR